MRNVRTLLALAALCTAAACADGAARITAPDAAARSGGGTWIGSGSVASSDSAMGGGSVSSNTTAPADSTGEGRGGGGWIGSGN